MAYTLTQYSAVCAAIASGERRVKYDGKEVEFRSIAELMQAKASIEAELTATGQLAAPDAGGTTRGSTTYAAYCPD